MDVREQRNEQVHHDDHIEESGEYKDYPASVEVEVVVWKDAFIIQIELTKSQ